MTVAAVVAFGPLGLAALASGQAVAYIAFSDGTLHETAVKGNKDLRQAELDVVRFNALAASSQPAEGFAGDAALHLSGMLDDEEFRAAKARIIHGG
jgi:hypothetical protein